MLSKWYQDINTGGGGVHGEELEGHLQKVYPNESGSLERFAFMKWYIDEEVSLEYTDEAEHLMGLGL